MASCWLGVDYESSLPLLCSVAFPPQIKTGTKLFPGFPEGGGSRVHHHNRLPALQGSALSAQPLEGGHIAMIGGVCSPRRTCYMRGVAGRAGHLEGARSLRWRLL